MLPSLGQGVEEHSVWFAETVARLQRSIPPIFETVYGADGHAAGHRVRDFHKPIKGKLPDGSPYSALNPETYYWAHACFVEHLMTATDTFIRRLSEQEKEQIVAESVTWYERYGVSARDIPRTYAEFTAYTAAGSGALGQVLQQIMLWAAPCAPVLWFLAALAASRGGRTRRLAVLLLLGAVVLLPLPMLVASGA